MGITLSDVEEEDEEDILEEEDEDILEEEEDILEEDEDLLEEEDENDDNEAGEGDDLLEEEEGASEENDMVYIDVTIFTACLHDLGEILVAGFKRVHIFSSVWSQTVMCDHLFCGRILCFSIKVYDLSSRYSLYTVYVDVSIFTVCLHDWWEKSWWLISWGLTAVLLFYHWLSVFVAFVHSLFLWKKCVALFKKTKNDGFISWLRLADLFYLN